MANKKYLVELTVDERVHLSELIKKGKSSAQSNLKARILLKADQGDTGEHWLDKDICTALDTNMSMVGRVRETFVKAQFTNRMHGSAIAVARQARGEAFSS